MPARKNGKQHFTKAMLEDLKPDAEETLVFTDDKAAGLILRVFPSGKKTFVFYRKLGGRPRRANLGEFPAMTIENARKAAMKFGAEIADGRDPFLDRKAAKQELTFGELHQRFVEEHSKPHKKSWRDDEGLFNRYLTGWKNGKLKTITRAEIQKRHQRIGQETPIAANRTLAMVSKMFSFAQSIGLWDGENPAKGIQRFRERSRERFLQPDEMPLFLAALDAEPNEVARDYLKLSLMLGARRSNMLAMTWGDLNFERGEWRIPETKNGDALTVHLPSIAVDVLRARQQTDGSSQWVFPGIGKTGHLVEPKAVWKRILNRAGLADLRIHDLRRTLGSWQAAAGVSLHTIGKSLGHKNQSTTAIYARLNLDPVRVAVDAAVTAMFKSGSESQ